MDWIMTRTAPVSLLLAGQLSEKCASLGGGPLTAELIQLVRNKDYLSLVNFEIDYLQYDSRINDVLYARQILGFFQKLDCLDLGFDKEHVACHRFALSERMCSETNRRFKALHRDPARFADQSRVTSVLHRAQRKIASVLGVVPSLDRFQFEFGPGANTNVKGTLACPRAKLSVPLECSSNLTPTVGVFLSEVPHWTAMHAVSESDDSYTCIVSVAPGKVVFVPKNAKTDRSIVVEPLLNSFFQKGIGSYMKARLLRSGVNLYDQTINQRLAALGSVNGLTATVDLSMASDCLAIEVVASLLPFDWFDLLDQLRSSEVTVPPSILGALNRDITEDRPLRLEKFSSMGNGYTFELESLIFYGLCSAVCEELQVAPEVSVYGDDLIVPVETFDLLKEVLAFCGFSINTEKSFCAGFFRESCGADYFHGFDIRPFYLKTQVSDRILFSMHNWFVRHCERELAALVETFLHPPLILRGPDGYGDGHLIGSHCLRFNRGISRKGWDGGYFDTYALTPRSFSKLLPGDAVLPVYSVYTRSGKDSPTDPNVIRGSNGYAKISIYTLSRSIFESRH